MIAVESDALQFLHSKLRAIAKRSRRRNKFVLHGEEKDKET